MQQENKIQFDMLLQSLQLLAASYKQQIEVFPPFVDIPDEIVLTFDEVHQFTDALIQSGFLTLEQKESIEQINLYLDQLSSGEDVWNLSSLQTSYQWENVREMASNVLALMHVPKQAPNLFWVQYVA